MRLASAELEAPDCRFLISTRVDGPLYAAIESDAAAWGISIAAAARMRLRAGRVPMPPKQSKGKSK